MRGSIHCILVVLAVMVAMLLPDPALSSPAASAVANIVHHEGGGGGKGNPANSLVAQVNANRTAAKLPPLRNSKGLGCMVLQYISHCDDNSSCGDDGTVAPACHPPEADVTEVYAANCGVELPTVGLVSARLLGCSRSGDAMLVLGAGAGAKANATVVRGKEHTQVGAGILRQRRHGPYFWCLLFSGGSPGSTFRLEAAGKGIAQTQGCFSDPDDTLPCSNSGGRDRVAYSMAVPAAALLLLVLSYIS